MLIKHFDQIWQRDNLSERMINVKCAVSSTQTSFMQIKLIILSKNTFSEGHFEAWVRGPNASLSLWPYEHQVASQTEIQFKSNSGMPYWELPWVLMSVTEHSYSYTYRLILKTKIYKYIILPVNCVGAKPGQCFNRHEVRAGQRQLHAEELQNLYSLLSILGPLGRASRSHCLHGLRHELSSFARKLWSWVRIPLEALMSVLYAFILCVGSGLATGWSPVQAVLPTVYRIKKLKKRPRRNIGL
jgi:hypothetical protein